MTRATGFFSTCLLMVACSSRAPSTNANAVEPRDLSSGQESAAATNTPATATSAAAVAPTPSVPAPTVAPATATSAAAVAPTPSAPAAAQQASLTIHHGNLNPSSIPPEYLEAVRHLDIFWGRQSVGGNIVQGLERLSSENPARYALALQYLNPAEARIYEARDLLGIFELGTNGEPASKTDAFRRDMVELGFGERVDVAMMKFCYVDFGEGLVDPERTFETYRSTMESLERAYPRVRFVWWTVPLMTTGSAARDRFNAKVRAHVTSNGKTLFDIADIESHTLQGAPVRQGGYEAMHPAYSADGGHLNEAGQTRAAGAFWVLMARLAGWPG